MSKKIVFKDLESVDLQKSWWNQELKECGHCYRIPGYNTPSNIKFSRKPINCVDVGANVGTFSYYVANLFENVYAYEAMVETYDVAKENLKNFKNVNLFNKAVYREGGSEVKIYKNESGLTGDSSIYGTGTENFNLVNTVSLENILEKNNIDFIDYMKVDCEGAEYDFLMGKDLRRILFMTMELHPGFIGQDNANNLIKYIEESLSLEFKIGDHIYFFKNKKEKL